VAERAAKRQAMVNPILQQKRWKPGRLATKAGVGKNSVYQHLDGTRAKITTENRKAIAQALELGPGQLPD
jgi:DNA-binding Xre family transcriptional regulator